MAFDFIAKDTTFSQIHFGSTGGSAAGTENRSDAVSNRYRIILWFQPSGSHSANAAGTIVVPAKTGDIRRMIFCDCRSVELSTSMAADDMLKGSINFEFSSTDSNGYANYFDEFVTTTTTALTVLTTTAHKGTLTWNATTPAWTASYRT